MKTELSDVRPRGLWRWWPLRFVVLLVVVFGAAIGCQFIPLLLLREDPGISKGVASLIAAAVCVVVVVVLYRLLVGWTERRAATELRFEGALVPLVVGMVTGLSLFAVLIGCLWLLGIASLHGLGTTAALERAAALSIMAAVGEEVAFRGVAYRLFEEGFGTTLALILSGALFGLLHIPNPGATLASTAAIALEAGVLLAAAYVLTRSLWFPIGLHFGWNFTEGGIFGAAVSGGKSKGLLAVSLHGSDVFTGGAFGPEASVVAVALCFSAALVMLALAARRGRWQSMRLRFRARPG